MSKKILTVRHMEEKRDDYVARFLDQNGIAQTHVNPACGIPMPDNPDAFDALLIYGGIQSANDGDHRPYIKDELTWLYHWLKERRPTLGICLGAQLIAKSLGATVAPHPDGLLEVGFRQITPTAAAEQFLPAPAHFYQWHGEGFTLPNDSELLAVGEQFPNQAFCYAGNTYGIQFHPEVTRPVMMEWLTHGCHSLDEPGAHSAEQQLEDEAQYGEQMGRWCQEFVSHWMEKW